MFRGFAVNGLAAAMRRPVLVTLLIAACWPASTALADSNADITEMLSNVPGSTAYRYGATDSAGNEMNYLKIIPAPTGGYIGVYHSWSNGSTNVNVATSGDLLTWTFRRELDLRSAQPTIAAAPDGYVVAYMKGEGCSGAGGCLYFRHYPSYPALLAAISDRQFRAQRTLSSCAEGSPNIYSVTATSIDVGLHYLENCGVARQARGTLTNWSSWSVGPDTNTNNLFGSLGTVNGNVRGRESGQFGARSLNVHEAQLVKDDPSSWRPFLLDAKASQLWQLPVTTHGGSRSFTGPSFTFLTSPHRLPAVVVTYYIQSQGAAPGEAGQLIFYREFPVLAAAGDIACASSVATATRCRQQATSDLLSRATAVLPLGDNQYEDGLLPDYVAHFEPTWGRFKSRTFPTSGNHEYQSAGAAGYFDYFNGPGNTTGVAGNRTEGGYYSFDIGTWHVISLNSNCSHIPRGTAANGCAVGSPQEQWLRADLTAHPSQCVLAYWHHPRFSSGSDSHGDQPRVAPFWDALYAAGAEVILSGHTHNYERFAKQTPSGTYNINGIREFVVGTGGASHYSFGTPRANSLVRNADTFGILELTLYPSGWEWKFVPERGKTFTDQGLGAQCR
jgi:hypothetical protein